MADWEKNCEKFAEKYIELGLSLKADDVVRFSIDDIVFDPRTLLKCMFGCSDWGKGPTCPSRPGSLSPWEYETVFKKYHWGLIVHSTDKKIAQNASFALERQAFFDGFYFAFSLSDCAICKECRGLIKSSSDLTNLGRSAQCCSPIDDRQLTEIVLPKENCPPSEIIFQTENCQSSKTVLQTENCQSSKTVLQTESCLQTQKQSKTEVGQQIQAACSENGISLLPTVFADRSCANPKKARPAFHSVGIDVFATVRKFGLPLKTLGEKTEETNWYAAVFIE